MKLSSAEVARLVGGSIVSGPRDAVTDTVSIDTRTLEPGDLFFAIRGPRHDGHQHAADALAKGAVGIVASSSIDVKAPAFLVRVEDTTRALQDLANGVRERAGIKVVAITGSMGKTTTKDAAAAAIRSRYRVLQSEGNLNNLYGLPLSLLKLGDEEVAVLEMGMSEPGEIARLTEIARPDVGLLTNVAEVHLEFFPSVAAIAEAKGELLVGLRPGATAVINADDPLVLAQARRFSGRTLAFGLHDADVSARDVRTTWEGLRFRAVSGSEIANVVSPLLGRHNVYNLVAGLAAAKALDVPLSEAAHGVQTVIPPSHRGERLTMGDNIVVIDETYNSNPRALSSALDAFLAESDVSSGGRHLVVVGDMLELGPRAAELHRELGREAATKGVDLLLGVGPLSRHVLDGARENGMSTATTLWAADADEAGRLIAAEVRSGDRLLFKGSRGIGLERAVELLRLSTEGEAR